MPAKLSVLVAGRDRAAHLANLVDGLRRSSPALSFELLVAATGDEDPRAALARARGFEARAVAVADAPARALGELAAAARGEMLIFLDVDCIPSHGLLATYAAALGEHDALAVGETRYLPRGFVARGAEESSLRRAATRRPERLDLFPATGELRLDSRHELFTPLNFGLRRATFEQRIGGFDGASGGDATEDGDFAMRCARAEVPLAWLGGALAFHQWHPG